jgi:predicted nucleic acid-binding protein
VIFVDSSFWIALSDRRDGRHEQATALLRTHQGGALVTTNHVCGETWTFLRKRHGHRAAVRFLDTTEGTARLRVAAASEEVEREAWSWLRRHDERVYSFVDATSFALMRSLGIREALAFDDDFTAAGFVQLRTA